MLPGHHSEADKGPSFSMCPASHCGLSPEGPELHPTQEPVLSSWVAAHSWKLCINISWPCLSRVFAQYKEGMSPLKNHHATIRGPVPSLAARVLP